MQPLANVGGVIQPLSDVRISPLDRGFLFGDAVYEVARVYRGYVFLLDEHLARLGRSLAVIRISGVDVAAVGRRMRETVAAGPFQEATVYVQITRGAYPARAHLFPAQIVPYEIIWVEEFRDTYGEARRIGVQAMTHPDWRWERCDVKSVNLLPNVLASQAAKEAGAAEVIFHNPDGAITEGARTNVFGVLDGVLRTRPLGPEILPGITREFVLDLARGLGIPSEERALNLTDLPKVSELFFSGTTSEVLPIVGVDGNAVGDGKPGIVARRLHTAFQNVVNKLAS